MGMFTPVQDEADHPRRFHVFQNLIRFRVHELLLVSSLYDSFVLEEDGQLYEKVLSEYHDLNLSRAPGITCVADGGTAFKMLTEEPHRFDLVITTLNLGDMQALEFGRKVREAGLDTPVVLMTYDNRELNTLLARKDTSVFEKVFVWQGDFRILIAIIKYMEDKRNVAHDTEQVGLQSIIVIEDNVSFYSSYLPMIYTELFRHSQTLISEGINVPDKLLRMRARPKILLCSTYEEAWEYYASYEDCILGVISDIAFPREGTEDPEAGIRFARAVKRSHFDIPILIQSDSEEHAEAARRIGASFLLKSSPLLLHELGRFMKNNFSFGPFVFYLPDGTKVGEAADLRSLEEALAEVPGESIRFHGERNHFSNWLKARTEFWLAHKLRPRRVSEYSDVEELRRYLIDALRAYRRRRERGRIADFNPETFDPEESFARVGGGSLGGKARGLAFTSMLLTHFNIDRRFPGVRIDVPPSLVLGTDVFDQFLDENALRDFAIQAEDDAAIKARFLEAPFPETFRAVLASYLERATYPLAVRSSSLLEDSRYMPFTGVYLTCMLPNHHPDPKVRLESLVRAVKCVYASTFFQRAKTYLQATHYRLEEEKMGVILQKLVGAPHEDRFYPDFAGVARSHNFYPRAPMTSEDGIVSVGLGLGKLVIEGGQAVRFCPRYPAHPVQYGDLRERLRYSQREFLALLLGEEGVIEDPSEEREIVSFGLDTAERDGTLHLAGSTYDPDNEAVYEGLSRRGIRLVTFDPILKGKLFPLPEILDLVMAVGKWGMSSPVEVEFAVSRTVPEDAPREFGILQVRPLVMHEEFGELEVEGIAREACVVQSPRVLGHGEIETIYDVIMVDPRRFDRSRTREAAEEVARFNRILVSEERPYLLIGMGRWGSADPWLGIPVRWEQVSGARVIVEAGFSDFHVEPSQGTHFFQNLVSFKVGYFTVNAAANEGFVDWEWLGTRPPAARGSLTRHLRFDRPLRVKMNGKAHQGVVLKPEPPGDHLQGRGLPEG